MREDLVFYKELDEEEKKKYRLFDKNCRKELVATNCSYCGQQKVVYTRFYEPSSGYEDHSHYYGMQFVCGGKSGDKRILCDTCLIASARIDLLNDLEGKIENAEEDLEELRGKVKKISGYLKDVGRD